jgi:large subunit ribosomal protein L21
MYAVIKTGGKQYRVSAGDKIKVETIAAEVGASVTLSDVLMVAHSDQVSVGTPMLNGASVSATVVSQGRHDKVKIFKMRRRKHYQKHQGHRQNYSEIFITAISDGAGNTVASETAPVIKTKADDLIIIEGIGPKIAQVLAANGITTFAQLAKTEPAAIQDMLKKSSGRFGLAKPETWAQQAELAAAGNWDALKKLQDELHGGVKK